MANREPTQDQDQIQNQKRRRQELPGSDEELGNEGDNQLESANLTQGRPGDTDAESPLSDIESEEDEGLEDDDSDDDAVRTRP